MSQPYNLSQLADNVNSSGVLQPSGGGTGTTSTTGSGASVLATSPTLVTPALGTPSAVNLTNATNVPVNQATGTLGADHGGTGTTTLVANAVLLGNGTSALQSVSPGSTGNILTSNGTTWLSSAPAPGMVYPSSGIANSTGSSWGTSYAVTGTGSVVLNSGATIGTPAITGGSINNTPIGGTTAAAGSFTTATIQTATITGGTVTTAPSGSNDLVNKNYVDSAVSSLNTHASVNAATTANLTATYSNGTAGVGATLTNSGTQAAFVVDGYTASVNDRILVKNQTTQFQNGVYVVTTVGSGSTNWVLTRASDANVAGSGANQLGPGDYFFVTSGTNNASTGWTQTTNLPITIGTTAIVFTQFSGAGTYTAGTGLSLTGSQFANTGVLSVTTNTGLSTNTASTGAVTITNTAPMVYPASGIANSTGAGWSTSYTTSGSGTILALTNSPSFTTPTLGAAIATTINKVTFTAPATGSILTIADGKTLTASNTITFTATDGSTLGIGTGGTLGASAYYGTSSNAQYGSLGVGTAASGTAGEIRATNNITAYYSSDIRFKENIKPIENALSKIEAIGGKEFDWTDDYINAHGGEDGYFIAKEDFGVVAQDVQKVFPKAVKTRPDGSLAVDYTKLGVLAFQGILELLKRVEALEAK